jgi:starch-binding outer membrane protein, SusD/RagB family
MNRIKIFLIGLVSLLLFSCKKILEKTPDSAPTSIQFWKNAGDVELAVLGNYSLLRTALSTRDFYVVMGDCSVAGVHGGDYNSRIRSRNLIGSVPSDVLDWRDHYKAIAQSNLIIQKISELLPVSSAADVVKLNYNLGEAHFLRALTYFYLTRVWGDVPVETQSYDNPLLAQQKGRSPKAEVFNVINDDIIKASTLLKNANIASANRAIRASYFSVKALQAHFNLWRARMEDVKNLTTNVNYLDIAKTAIDEIKASARFSLVDAADYKKVTEKQSPESIFEIPFDEANEEGNQNHIGLRALATYRADPDRIALTSGNGALSGITAYSFGDMVVYNNFVSDFYGSTRATDIRFNQLYEELGPNSYNNTAGSFVLKKYDKFIYRDAGTRTNPVMSYPLVVFRYADILLLEAEYFLYKGNAGAALPIVNSFRTRYGNDPLPSVDLYDYFIERVKELHYEGHAYYDMLRTREYNGFVDPYNGFDNAGFSKECFYFPISSFVFNDNPFMKQTPFWLGRL